MATRDSARTAEGNDDSHPHPRTIPHSTQVGPEGLCFSSERHLFVSLPRTVYFPAFKGTHLPCHELTNRRKNARNFPAGQGPTDRLSHSQASPSGPLTPASPAP